MTKFDPMKGVFGLLPTPYTEDLEIHTTDLQAAANFCCESGQHGIVWPVMVGEFYFLGEEERIRNLDAVLETVNGRLPTSFWLLWHIRTADAALRKGRAAGSGEIR